MKICAVIVTYNGVKWIEACLNSLKKSSLNIKIIVIDNASTDLTTSVIKNNFPEVLLIEKEINKGFGEANNIGMAIALKENMDYVFLLNQDAFAEPDTIEKLVGVAKENKSYGVLSPIHLNGTGDSIDDSFLYYLKNQGNNEFLSDLVMNKVNKDIYEFKMINAAAWLLPKRTLEIVGGFSPLFFMYGEDINYVQRVHYHNLRIGIIPNAYINHDSENNYHPEFKPGTDEYFDKFTIRTKIVFADVNSSDNNIEDLKFSYLKQILKSVFKLNFKEYKLNLRKYRIINAMNLEAGVQNERKKGPTHLPIDIYGKI